MRKLIIAGALGALVDRAFRPAEARAGARLPTRLCSGRSDIYAISQIERNFHESMAKKDIEEMMSLWTDERDLHVRPRADGDGEGADPADLAELEVLRALDALEC